MTDGAIPKDIVDSMRLDEPTYSMSAPAIDCSLEKTSDSMIDIDIDALDAEFERLSLDFKKKMVELRENSNSTNMLQTFNSAKEALNSVQTWSSLVKTTDGLAIIKKLMTEQRQKDLLQQKYEIDQILKISKIQSSIDLCFLMDCTGSMRPYLRATKTQIRRLTKTIIELYSTKPHLAFVGYRDINEDLEKLDFTNDEDTFLEFLSNVQAIGGDDTCEDVFSEC